MFAIIFSVLVDNLYSCKLEREGIGAFGLKFELKVEVQA
jgi:hypothetical protein